MPSPEVTLAGLLLASSYPETGKISSEVSMVAVIEEKEESGSARYIEFRVCRSPTDPDHILGSWCFSGASEAVIDQSRPDSPVQAEFRHVLECADQNGVAFVWVNDPDQLFPRWARW